MNVDCKHWAHVGSTYQCYLGSVNNRKGCRIGEITTAVLTKSDSDRIVCSQLVSIYIVNNASTR